jgi:hypothetical protein
MFSLSQGKITISLKSFGGEDCAFIFVSLFLLLSTWCYIDFFYAFISIFNWEYICSYLSHLAQRILDRSHSPSKSAKVLLLKVAVSLFLCSTMLRLMFTYSLNKTKIVTKFKCMTIQLPLLSCMLFIFSIA